MNKINTILSSVLNENKRLTVNEAALLFECADKAQIQIIKEAANTLRHNIAGDNVSYIINFNVNFTNICEAVCLFCGFRRNENTAESYVLDLDEFEDKLNSMVKEGITEICLQGGLYSNLKIPGLKSNNILNIYAELLQWVKERHSHIHIHAYSPEEIEFLSILSGKSLPYILEYMKDSGLGSMPGTAAEILNDEIRTQICAKKLNTARWTEVVSLAHKLQIPTTATIMFGHIETPFHRAEHLGVLRDIQDKTGGFTEFIPLPFIATKTLLSDRIKPLTSDDRLKMLAISRLFFKESIPNIQASWVKQGMEETAEALNWGVNDVGGTLGDERITYEAGGSFGRNISRSDLVGIITSQNRNPVERDTLYNYIKQPVTK